MGRGLCRPEQEAVAVPGCREEAWSIPSPHSALLCRSGWDTCIHTATWQEKGNADLAGLICGLAGWLAGQAQCLPLGSPMGRGAGDVQSYCLVAEIPEGALLGLAVPVLQEGALVE